MNASQVEQFEIFAEQFLESEEWLPFHSVCNYDLVVQHAHQRTEAGGGYPSFAAFELAAEELIRTGVIERQFVTEEEKEEAEYANLTLDQFRRTPSATSQQLYRTNPRYKAAVDRLFAEEEPVPVPAPRSIQPVPQAKQAQRITLTVAEYRSLPSSVLQKRYRQEPAFAQAVDELISSGQV